jgi:hypothetical protein
MHIQPRLYFLILIIISLTAFHCAAPEKPESDDPYRINTAHLDSLYQELVRGADTIGIVHIYAEHPDYQWKGDDDEGIACVDDASRAAIFYLKQYQKTALPAELDKGRKLIRFLLSMQSPNGYFYNFIWPDGTINMDGITSKPEPNFWSCRVLWAFGEALNVLDPQDALVPMIIAKRDKLVRTMLNEPGFRTNKTDTTMGWSFPTWLPRISGTDQAAIVLTGLTLMHQQQVKGGSIPNDSIEAFIDHFADGIMEMQIESPDSLFDGAFLSWENLWHAYANIQSYALLQAGEAFNDPHMVTHAMYEIDHFYPSVLHQGGLEHFFIRVDSGVISHYDKKQFSQIAYGRRPMVWASVKAYEMTTDQKYLDQALQLAAWFKGDNAAEAVMYDPQTGRGYDGINNATSINRNAGAESTIEALLTLQAIEKYIDEEDKH